MNCVCAPLIFEQRHSLKPRMSASVSGGPVRACGRDVVEGVRLVFRIRDILGLPVLS